MRLWACVGPAGILAVVDHDPARACRLAAAYTNTELDGWRATPVGADPSGWPHNQIPRDFDGIWNPHSEVRIYIREQLDRLDSEPS
jgi:hypothetical protein